MPLLHGLLLLWFWVYVRPQICEELDETNLMHRIVGHTLSALLLINIGLLGEAVRPIIGL